MKRIIVLVFVLLTFIPVATAESNIDIQNLSTEELVNLRNVINSELSARNFANKEVTVPPGRYSIGVDIPAGVYTINHSGMVMAVVSTYTENGNYDLLYTVTQSSPIGKLELKDGQVIEIGTESVVFKPYEGIGF